MQILFPEFTGIRCLMMPYVQGRPESVPEQYRVGYEDILEKLFFKKGDIGFLTIDESLAVAGIPHRGARSKYSRALHTEAGLIAGAHVWGGYQWGGKRNVTLDRDVKILLANSVDDSCAIWQASHFDTSDDGDIGNFSSMYPYENAMLMKNGQVEEIGILTPHESLPVNKTVNRQFLRIISSGVHGREEYFTTNPLI